MKPTGPALKVRPFIDPANITRKRAGDIIMTSSGYVKYLGPRRGVVPYNPASWKGTR